jgi:hypothetical protein
LLFLLAIVALAVTLFNYRVGIWFLVFLLPLSSTTIFPRQLFGITGANPYNLLLGITIVAFVLRRAYSTKVTTIGVYLPRLWWAYVLPIVAAALVGVRHIHEIPSFVHALGLVHFTSADGYLRDALIKPLTYVFLSLLIGLAIQDGMKPRSVVVAMCMSVCLLTVYIGNFAVQSGLSLATLSNASARESFAPTGLHANGLGAFAAMGLTMMVFALTNKHLDHGLRWLFSATAALSGILLLISFSRGGFVAFAVGLTIFLISQRQLKIIAISILAAGVIFVLLPAEFYDRLLTGLGTGRSMALHRSDDPLTAGRVAGVWIPLLPVVFDHPVFGNGLLSIAWSAPLRNGSLALATLHPHNVYLKILLEMGFVGLILMILFFIELWKRFRHAAISPSVPKEMAWVFSAAAASLVGYAVLGFTAGDYLPVYANGPIWISLGLLLGFPARETTVLAEQWLKPNSPTRHRYP